MKKFLKIFLILMFSLPVFANTHIKIKKPVPLLYSNDKIQDIVDIAILDVTDDISTSEDPFVKQKLIDFYVKKVCDQLVASGYEIPVTPPLYIPDEKNPQMLFGVPVMDFEKSYSFYSYPSWFVKTTDYQGTRMIEVIDKNFEKEAVKLNEASILGLPLKLLFLISNFGIGGEKRYYFHILMVDPEKYLENFFTPSQQLKDLFINAKSKILNEVKVALKNINGITFQYVEANYSKKVSSEPLIFLEKVDNIGIEEFVDEFLKTPDILTNIGGDKVRYISHNLEDLTFPYNYTPDFLNENQTEITGILSFCRFILPTKNIWLSFYPDSTKINYLSMLMLMEQMSLEDFNLPKSEPMEFMIKNSLVHIYARYFPDNQTAEKYITFKYETKDNRKIYVLSLFDPYITTSLLTSGQWHKPFSYINIYIYQFKDGSIGIFAKNPIYLIEKYYSDIPNNFFKQNAEVWNNTPTTMFYFPEMTKIEMGEFMLNKLKKLINLTLENMGVKK